MFISLIAQVSQCLLSYSVNELDLDKNFSPVTFVPELVC